MYTLDTILSDGNYYLGIKLKIFFISLLMYEKQINVCMMIRTYQIQGVTKKVKKK